MREWNAQNRERTRAYKRVWFEKNPEYRKEYRAKNLEKLKAAQKLWHATEGRFRQRQKQGIQDAHLVDECFALQGNRCAICKTTEPGGKGTWHADHEHESGLLRGLLCSRCNLGIGQFGDCIKRLFAAILYLLNPPAKKLREQKS